VTLELLLEAQAREHYYLFRAMAEEALADVYRVDAELRKLKLQSAAGADDAR